MKNKPHIFGWKAVLKGYGWSCFCSDCILPLFASSALCVLANIANADILVQLQKLIKHGISIIPAMVALILTAYTIMLTFITGDKFESIKNTEKGRKLIQNLNSSFAFCLLVSTISIIVMIIVSSISDLGIEIKNANFVNYPTYFCVCFLCIYSVSILIGIIIDVFNCGQTTLLE